MTLAMLSNTAYIRTDVAGVRADCKEIDSLHGISGCVHSVENRAATCFHGAAQIALIQLIGTFPAIQSDLQIEMAIINIAIQEDIPNALALGNPQHESFPLGLA
jgi:hypothetical protein